MKILGLSFDFHDSAAAILVDGKIIAAAQEERFTRVKHDAAFPRRSIDFCLKQAGLTLGDLDRIVYYENSLKKFDRILWASEQNMPRSQGYLDSVVHSWFKWEKFDAVRKIAAELKVPREKVTFVDHHDSHLAAAYYCSPFEHAAIVTLDGVGEYETGVIAVGRGNTIERKVSINLPHSLGLLYSAFTAFLGFEVNEGEYKVMGMAAFGKPTHYDEVRKLVTLKDDGSYEIDQSCFEFLTPTTLPYTDEFRRRFGTPRVPESPFAVAGADLPAGVGEGDAGAIIAQSEHYANIAASVQKVTEEVIMHVCDHAVRYAGTKNLCLAGGVALNSLANGRLIRERGYTMFIQPAAGDSGNAIGAAARYFHTVKNGSQPRMKPFQTPYLGSAFAADEISAAIKESGYENVTLCNSTDELAEKVAELLAGGAIIGWMQGQAEWGPRALGARSILADPTNPNMKRMVNERVKFRELFRPFAPAVPAESAAEYFEFTPDTRPGAPEYYMLAVHPVREHKKSVIPAVTHADGTARVQIVTTESNPVFYRLLKAFGARKGVPVLMNTSFNLRGEPIVDSPRDALKTFGISGIDYLVLGNHIISSEISL